MEEIVFYSPHPNFPLSVSKYVHAPEPVLSRAEVWARVCYGFVVIHQKAVDLYSRILENTRITLCGGKETAQS